MVPRPVRITTLTRYVPDRYCMKKPPNSSANPIRCRYRSTSRSSSSQSIVTSRSPRRPPGAPLRPRSTARLCEKVGRPQRLVRLQAGADGLVDVAVRAAVLLAQPGEDVELVPDRPAAVRDVEQVARVGVSRDQRQGPPFTHAADQDRRMRPAYRVRVVDRARQPVVGPFEGGGLHRTTSAARAAASR